MKKGVRKFMKTVVAIATGVAMWGCTGSGSEREEKSDSISPDRRAVMPREIRPDSLPDSLPENYEAVMREFEHLENVRTEQDRVLNMRLNEETRINQEPESERSDEMLRKGAETQQLYELQRLDDIARPMMQKIENFRRATGNSGGTAEMAKLLSELREIRGTQLELAYKLADGKLIKEYRKEIEKINDIEMTVAY